MSHPLSPLAGELAARGVRYVVIGVSGANLYGPGGQAVFTTNDFDLFMPLDADNLVRAWEACGRLGFDLWLGDEPSIVLVIGGWPTASSTEGRSPAPRVRTTSSSIWDS